MKSTTKSSVDCHVYLPLKLLSTTESLSNLMEGMSFHGSKSIFFFALKRLAASLENPELCKTVLKMLSLLDEKNITPEILTSLTEVAISYSPESVSILSSKF